MKSTLRRAWAWFMVVMMLISCMPMNALAEVIKVDTSESGQYLIRAIRPTTGTYSTYEFVLDGTSVSKQVIKAGDTLYEPELTEKDGYKFMGWYESETPGEGDTAFNTFGNYETVDGADHTYYAVYAEVYYVFFMDNEGRVYTTKEGTAGDKIAADVKFPVNADEGIVGWYTDEALTNMVTDVTLSDKNVTLWPRIEEGHWITYNSNGGTYIEPKFVAPGATTSKPADPTRAGFNTPVWYLDANVNGKIDSGEGVFEFGKTLDENVTLIAKWTGNKNTKFTIVYWAEDANSTDDNLKYNYVKTAEGSGTAGEVPTLTTAQMAISNIGGD